MVRRKTVAADAGVRARRRYVRAAVQAERRQLVRQGHLLRAGRGRRAVQRAEQRRVLERRQRGRAHLFQEGVDARRVDFLS